MNLRIFLLVMLIKRMYPYCSPLCPVTQTCISNACVSINDNTGPCNSLSDCKDTNPIKADCVNNKCICKDPYIWSWFTFTCLGKNTGIAPCSVSEECIDPVSGAGDCVDGKCVCKKGSGWDDFYRACGNPNDGYGCSKTADCIDHYVVGSCWHRRCLCSANYVYSETQIRCVASNGFGIACSSLADCQATNAYAFCDGICKCLPGYDLKKDDSKFFQKDLQFFD